MTVDAPPGWRLHTHETLASTQDEAIAAARAGDPGRLAVLAARQTAGRGRGGRAWVAPEGNLNLSVLLRPASPVPAPGRWALMAGLALHDALSCHTSGLTLKWPNDVLLHGAKLAGILIDTEVVAGAVAWIVIGMGANLRAAPYLPDREVAHLPPPAPPAQQVAAAVLSELEARFNASDAALRDAWLDRAHKLGTTMEVQLPHRRVTGAFAGLTDTGELLLAGYETPISSGEVVTTAKQGLLF